MPAHEGDEAASMMGRMVAFLPRRLLVSAAGYGIGPVFLVLAAWFVLGPELLNIPAIGDHSSMKWTVEEIRSGTLRKPPADPPFIVSGGYELSCMECHRLFTTPSPNKTPFGQHTDIVLNHGMNDRCLNCHHRSEREKLVLPGGEMIAFKDAPRLCATCHGTTYRDWQRGMHGRTTGSWDEDSPNHRRLICTECHNPHSPAFEPVKPYPGPNTLRMKPQSGYGDHEDGHEKPHHTPHGTKNPLQKKSARRKAARPLPATPCV